LTSTSPRPSTPGSDAMRLDPLLVQLRMLLQHQPLVFDVLNGHTCASLSDRWDLAGKSLHERPQPHPCDIGDPSRNYRPERRRTLSRSVDSSATNGQDRHS
jgi:hypothetical protein